MFLQFIILFKWTFLRQQLIQISHPLRLYKQVFKLNLLFFNAYGLKSVKRGRVVLLRSAAYVVLLPVLFAFLILDLIPEKGLPIRRYGTPRRTTLYRSPSLLFLYLCRPTHVFRSKLSILLVWLSFAFILSRLLLFNFLF